MIWLDGNQPEFCPFEIGPTQHWSMVTRQDWNEKDENGSWEWNLSQVQMGLHSPDGEFAPNGIINKTEMLLEIGR